MSSLFRTLSWNFGTFHEAEDWRRLNKSIYSNLFTVQNGEDWSLFQSSFLMRRMSSLFRTLSWNFGTFHEAEDWRRLNKSIYSNLFTVQNGEDWSLFQFSFLMRRMPTLFRTLQPYFVNSGNGKDDFCEAPCITWINNVLNLQKTLHNGNWAISE